jgi:ABC-type sugar transport system substrate-binding protein
MRFTSRFAAVAVGMAVALGAQAQVSGKRVALLTNTTASPWLAGFNGVVLRTLEKNGIRAVNWTSPQDPALQSQQIDDAIAQGYPLRAHARTASSPAPNSWCKPSSCQRLLTGKIRQPTTPA